MGWISVNDRMPEQRTTVLVYCKNNGKQFVARYSYNTWWLSFRDGPPLFEDYSLPTHWMHLPEPPKE